jgi:hypothetical protein
MFTSRRALALFASALACCTLPAQAAETVFNARMDGAQNVPEPVRTPAKGNVELRISADGKRVSYRVTLEQISNVSTVDLHLAPSTQNGAVIVKLWPANNGGTKSGPFSGVLAEGAFDVSDFTGPMIGATIADFVEEIQAGNIYANVHTHDGVDPPNSGPGDYRLGEIRGQVK